MLLTDNEVILVIIEGNAEKVNSRLNHLLINEAPRGITMTKEFFTLNEAAKILRVRRATIWLYVRSERLSIVTLACGEYRLRKSEIQKLLSNFNKK
jgi:hypothetical protein